MNQQDIKVVELFAGVGGFRLGLEASSPNFKTIWANQWEPNKKSQHAYDCYTTHFGRKNHSNINISIAKNEVPHHDLLVGGFPCQDYSVARTGAKGIEGAKGVLWWEIRDIIETHHPRFLLLENVDRLLKSPSSLRGRDFGIILRCLNDLGYIVEWRVINAAEYGFAQRRRRVFIFAVKHDRHIYPQKTIQSEIPIVEKANQIIFEEGLFANAFPVKSDIDSKKITHTSITSDRFNDLKNVSDKFSAAFFNSGVMIDGHISSYELKPIECEATLLGEILENTDVDEKYFLNGGLEKWQFLKGAKKINRIKPNGEPYVFAEGAMCFPDNLLAPARTMLTSESSINRSSHVVEDRMTGQLRTLTPVECERLNGFPDNWTNTGMPHKFRYFVMGNALVVPIVTKIANEIMKRR